MTRGVPAVPNVTVPVLAKALGLSKEAVLLAAKNHELEPVRRTRGGTERCGVLRWRPRDAANLVRKYALPPVGSRERAVLITRLCDAWQALIDAVAPRRGGVLIATATSLLSEGKAPELAGALAFLGYGKSWWTTLGHALAKIAKQPATDGRFLVSRLSGARLWYVAIPGKPVVKARTNGVRRPRPPPKTPGPKHTVFYDVFGERLNIDQMAARGGLSRKTIVSRIRNGWSPKDACTVAPQAGRAHPNTYAVGDERLTLREISDRCGVSVQLLRQRFERGESAEMAMNPKLRKDKGDLTGRVFLDKSGKGGLEVLGPAGFVLYGGRGGKRKQRHSLWRCKCLHCGNVKDIARGSLTSGASRSCGCVPAALAVNRAKQKSRRYDVFGVMLSAPDIAHLVGISTEAVRKRLKSGMSPEAVVRTLGTVTRTRARGIVERPERSRRSRRGAAA